MPTSDLELMNDPYFASARDFTKDRPQDEIDLFYSYYGLKKDEYSLSEVIVDVKDWHRISTHYNNNKGRTLVNDLRDYTERSGIAGLVGGALAGFVGGKRLISAIAEDVTLIADTYNMNPDLVNSAMTWSGTLIGAWVISELATKIAPKLFSLSLKKEYKKR